MANEDADPASHAVLAPSRRWPSAGHALAALAVYAVLVAALTWPLLPNAAVRMPATFAKFHFDTLHTAWMLSHESHALAAPWTVLDAQIYHPEPRTLFYSTLSLGLLPYFAPVYLATGNPTLALNLAFLGCVALTAWTIHLVVWRWTGDALAAGAGAVTFLVTRTLLWGFVSCAPYFGVLQYQPLLVYAAAAPASALATSPWLAALIALQCIADPLYVTPAVLLPLGVLALWRLRRRETRAAGWRLVRQLVVAGVLLAPVYAGYLDVVVRNPQLGSQSLYAARRAAGAPDVAGDPLPLSLLAYGHVIGWWNRFPVAPVALALVAIGAASVVVARARRAPDVLAAWRQCGYWALFAFLLPLLQNFGGVLRGMPRAGLVGLVALALLTGLAAAECAGRLRARLGSAAAAAALGTFVGLLLLVPSRMHLGAFGAYPIQPTPALASPLLTALRAGDGPVLEIPTMSPDLDAPALYRATVHRRPLVNGYSSYFPASTRRRMDQVKRLPHPLALGLLRIETGLTTIVVHTAELDAPTRAAWERVWSAPAERTDLRPVLRDGDVLVFDVVVAPLGAPAS